MANKTHFSPAFEKGRLDGLVDEGKYLRQSSLYKQILPRTPSRLKTSVKSAKSASKKLVPISVNSWIIGTQYATHTTNYYVRNYKKNMRNKANFRKSQMNVTDLLTRNYEKLDTWSGRKNKPNSNPIQTQTNPILQSCLPPKTDFFGTLTQ
jgi:hypothetical protein